jgi:cytochrome c oxidase subunit IV
MAEAIKKKPVTAAAHAPGEVHAHIGSYKGYGAIFGALIFLTVLTVAVSYVHLGKANLLVAVLIASIKATLVCTFFMHLKDDTKFHTLILIAAVTFIGVFFALTINDVSYRDKMDIQAGARTHLGSGDHAPGSWENPLPKEEHEGAEGAAEGAKPGESAAPAMSGSAPAPHGGGEHP